MTGRIPAYFIYPCLTVCMYVLPLRSIAQTGVWDDQKQTGKTAKAKAAKEISRIKKLRDHIKQWGLENDYDHELLVGGKLNSNGWSGGVYYFTKQKTGTYNYWQLQFSEIKHEKQIKQQPTKNAYPELGNSTSFVFGKINNLYTLQLGYGQEQLLLPGVIEGNLSVSFRYNAGFSLAMLKPYYLRLAKVDYTQTTPVATLVETTYSDSTAELFLNSANILGASKWGKELDETKLVPGAYVEAAFVITPNPKGVIEAITLGANGAIYTQTLPVMAELKASRLQVSLFAGLAIGKRSKRK